MAEYKLSYTAQEIDEKLGKVDILSSQIDELKESGVGEDGPSPTATVKETENGVVIIITDKNGTTTAMVKNGKDGGLYQYNEGEEVTASTDIEQKVIDAYTSMMSEAKGNYDKIPFILQTDNHGSYPANIYNLCAKMVNFAELSRVITLGDTVATYFKDSEMTEFANAMKVFPVEKVINVTGNHDANASYSSWVLLDQSKLAPYLRNYASKKGGTNGYFVSYDDFHKVKYIVTCPYDGEVGTGFTISGSKMSKQQADFILEELARNDNYDIIFLSHCPYRNTVDDSITLNKATDNGGDALMNHNDVMGMIPVLTAFKDKTTGTYKDLEGNIHNFDFTNCTNKLLLTMHGHTHPEGFYYTSDTDGILVYMFGSYKYGIGHPFYFGYVDRKDRYIKYWRVTDNADNVVINVGLDSSITVDGITLDKSTIDVMEGSTTTLTAFVSPLNASNQKVNWVSSDNNIATVDTNGKVTGIAKGSATITATTEDGGFTASCSVTVTAKQFVNVTGVNVEPAELRIIKGGSSTITATVIPSDATNKNVIWTSSDNSKATVTDGVVTAVAEGSATITATTEDGNFTASCVVNIWNKLETLPAEYQEVEYIRGDGNSYLNTNYIPTNESGFEITFEQESTKDTVLFGTSESPENRWNIGSVHTSQLAEYDAGVYSGWANEVQNKRTGIMLNTKYTFSVNLYNNRKRICNGEDQYSSNMGQVISLTTPAFIFGRNTSGVISDMATAKIYKIIITEGTSNIVHEYIPCYRKYDNAVGMYDIVGRTFLTNQGEGTLTAGVDITE